MSQDFLADRRKSLEEAFFAKQNAELRERMRAAREKQAAMTALAQESHIEDPEILERLVDLGLDGASWAALALVPLVEIAWADGEVQDKEREAVLAAAAEQGVEPGSPRHEMLDHWLQSRPGPALFATWGAYATELAAQLDPDERNALCADIVQRARRVAEAAGGLLLGIRSVSEAEKRVLAALQQPFAT